MEKLKKYKIATEIHTEMTQCFSADLVVMAQNKDDAMAQVDQHDYTTDSGEKYTYEESRPQFLLINGKMGRFDQDKTIPVLIEVAGVKVKSETKIKLLVLKEDEPSPL